MFFQFLGFVELSCKIRTLIFMEGLGSDSAQLGMVLKTGPGREPERGVVPVLVVRPELDRWSNR